MLILLASRAEKIGAQAGGTHNPMFDFSITADDPQTAARARASLRDTARQAAHPGLRAGGHPGDGQDPDPARPGRDRRDAGAGQHLSSLSASRHEIGCASFGGLHSFMGWPGPMLTDSGGFQVFSLAQMRKLDADGVTFRSHIDGSLHRFTPESAIASQEDLGADIIMCLDECAEPLDRKYNEEALARTHAWAARCQAAQAASRPGALRHRPGRHLSRSARRERPHPARPGFPRLRHRRAERGRDQGGDVRHARRDRAGAAARTNRAI